MCITWYEVCALLIVFGPAFVVMATTIKGERNKLGVLMVYARRGKRFRWLVAPVFGTGYWTNHYLDVMERRMDGRSNAVVSGA